MTHPKSFVKVSSISFLAFSLFVFFVGIVNMLAFGPSLQKNIYFLNDIPNGSLELFGSKLYQIDVDSILIIKIFCLIVAVINYLIYTLDAFTCADKLIYLQTTP
jgi:hypothetical protein